MLPVGARYLEFADYLVIIARGADTMQLERILTHRKDEILADMTQALGMITCNNGSEATFQRGNRSSVIDVTFATTRTATVIKNWRVVDAASLSDPIYIALSVQSFPHASPSTRPTLRLIPNKLTEFLASNPFPFDSESHYVESQAEAFSETITWIR